VTPAGGPNSGDTTLTLSGHNFDPSKNMSCVFGGDVHVPAVIASNSASVTCVTPPRSVYKNTTQFTEVDGLTGIDLDFAVNGIVINTTLVFFYFRTYHGYIIYICLRCGLLHNNISCKLF